MRLACNAILLLSFVIASCSGMITVNPTYQRTDGLKCRTGRRPPVRLEIRDMREEKIFFVSPVYGEIADDGRGGPYKLSRSVEELFEVAFLEALLACGHAVRDDAQTAYQVDIKEFAIEVRRSNDSVFGSAKLETNVVLDVMVMESNQVLAEREVVRSDSGKVTGDAAQVLLTRSLSSAVDAAVEDEELARALARVTPAAEGIASNLPDRPTGDSAMDPRSAYRNYAGEDLALDELAVVWSLEPLRLESVDGLLPDNGPGHRRRTRESHLEPGIHTVTASYRLETYVSGNVTTTVIGEEAPLTHAFAKGRVYKLGWHMISTSPPNVTWMSTDSWRLTISELGAIEEVICSRQFDIPSAAHHWRGYIEERCHQSQVNEAKDGSETRKAEDVGVATAGRIEEGASGVRVQYGVGELLLPSAFPVVIAVDGGTGVGFIPNSQATWVIGEGKHLLKVMDPEKGFMHAPDWDDYTTVLDLTGVASPTIKIQAAGGAPFSIGPVLHLTVSSGDNEIKKEEIHR